MAKPQDEWAKLIADYHRDNRQIARTKFKWLPPERSKNEKATSSKHVYGKRRSKKSKDT